jgi:hypothetical protein
MDVGAFFHESRMGLARLQGMQVLVHTSRESIFLNTSFFDIAHGLTSVQVT